MPEYPNPWAEPPSPPPVPSTPSPELTTPASAADAASASAAGALDGAHLAGITLDDAPAVAPEPAVPPGCMTREVFRKSFAGVFGLASSFTRLKSLAIGPHERQAADMAADAIYDTAIDVPWLRFLIEIKSPWLMRFFVIGAFTVPKALAVRAELMARGSRAPATNAGPGGAANDRTPPGLASFPTADQERKAASPAGR